MNIDENLLRKDEVSMQAELIKDMADEGKTRDQICEELSITHFQLRYRVETRFNKKTTKKILKKITENGIRERKKTRKPRAVKGKEKFKDNEKILVVDTSAFTKIGSIEFMMQFPKIILLLDVLDEMDRYKEKGGIFGANIKRFLRESAADVSGEKIEVHINEKIDSYTDKNIINYCIGKDDIVLYTADNALANRAKGYHIEYIMAEDNEQLLKGNQETKSQNIDNKEETEESENFCEKAEEEPVTVENEADKEIVKEVEIETKEELGETESVVVDTSEIVKNIYSNFVKENSNESIQLSVELTKANVSNVHMVGKNLCLELPDTTRIRYVVIGKDDKEKRPLIGTAMIKLEIGDKILVMVYSLQKYQGLGITMFEITDLRENEHAVYQEFHRVAKNEDIERLRWPREIKNTIKNYFSLVKRV